MTDTEMKMRNHPDRIAAMKKMKEIVHLMEDELNNDKTVIQYSLTIPMLIEIFTEAFDNYVDVEARVLAELHEEKQ